MALDTLLPIAVVAPLSMILVWWIVTRALAPVSRLQREVAGRGMEDLTPLSAAGLPDEVRPLVTELNTLFERVRAAFETQRNFVADAAHELRSPLAALKLQVRGLLRATDEAARGLAAHRLENGLDRATRLTEQLLVLARQQHFAAAPPAFEQVVLSDLVRRMVADLAPQALAKGLDLGVEQADGCRVRGDPAALAILLRNLVDNALKYTPAGGRVDVAIRCTARDVQLTVEDSGPGIPRNERERVLDRFYRLPGGDAAGSGLGLAIVKSIASVHGARLTLSSSAALGGLLVLVEFSRADGSPAKEATAVDCVSRRQAQGKDTGVQRMGQ